MNFRKATMFALMLSCAALTGLQAQGNALAGSLSYYTPGNLPVKHAAFNPASGKFSGNAANVPFTVESSVATNGDESVVTVKVTATRTGYFRAELSCPFEGTADGCLYYMPGFWYHKNLRSPEQAPSFKTSKSWTVREDRLSTPLTGIFNPATGNSVVVLRKLPAQGADCQIQKESGDMVLSGESTIGYTGFNNDNPSGVPALVFGYPYMETPKRYIRKLTLINPVWTFVKLDKGESRSVSWSVRRAKYADYSDFVAGTWQYSFDRNNPQPVKQKFSDDKAKEIMTNYFKEAYVDKYPLKYLASGGMEVATCNSPSQAEVGFIGRTVLNAFNSIEFGEKNNRPDLVKIGNNIIDSYLEHGFTPTGYFHEWLNLDNNDDGKVYSIRRQSEGAMAIFYYLQYEKEHGRKHAKWEERMKTLLNNFVKMQKADGSFARKFNADSKDVDASGGSTPCATLALAMGYKYFKNKTYLEAARKTIDYLDKNIISKSDYFSSTLDANCEDKEASFYACDALYYISFITKGKERARYIDLCKEAAYFCASWYYTWDVPFAKGQMLGDLGFKSRGWGNVSVENNHIDVYIFEFATIMKWLSANTNEPRFAKMADVIHTSMLQLMPVDGDLCGMGKAGYYPEVVQHTTWDYGQNGKGFYNTIFAPGWTVASLWTLLSEDRVSAFFGAKK